MARIPSLDGLRALSILMVVGSHTLQRFALTGSPSWIWSALFDGGTGVLIFFVLSGYLITHLLLHERRIRGSINLRDFYVRRAIRILPPLYFYLLILLPLVWGSAAISKTQALAALFFFSNFMRSQAWPLEHLWTLAIEEQFYLLWPIILLWGLYRDRSRGQFLAAKIALAVVVASPVVRVVYALLHGAFYGAFFMHADALMFGCAVALLQGSPAFESIYRRIAKIGWALPIVILASDCLGSRFQNHWNFPFGYSVCGLSTAFFMLWAIRNPLSAFGKFLNWRPIRHLGVLSYSVYIWQTLFLHFQNVHVFGRALDAISTFPGNWLAILIVAELSHRIVERPFLRLRKRLANP